MLRDLVRGRWGFDGVIVSDYGAIAELMMHGVAADLAEAAALALQAGIDIDLMGNAYARGLPGALERGRVTMADIDAAVRRILTLKAALGLFDDPYRRGQELSPAAARVPIARSPARPRGARSCCSPTGAACCRSLRTAARIAVLGPLADARADMLGPWAAGGRPEEMVTILEGLRAAFPAREVAHAPGVEIDGDDTSGIPAALDLARAAEVVVLCLGEARAMSGEAASRARPDLPGRQAELAKAVLDLGKPVVVTLSSGRPLMAPWLFERADAVLATWFLGSEAGHAVGDVLSGRHNPTARLPVSWPVDIGQIPIFYAQRPTGRPADPDEHYTSKYLDLPVEPLFPFGHGLSYTRFAYRDLRARSAELAAGRDDHGRGRGRERGRRGGRGDGLSVPPRSGGERRPAAARAARAWPRSRSIRGAHGTVRFTLSDRRSRVSRARSCAAPRARHLRDPRRPERGPPGPARDHVALVRGRRMRLDPLGLTGARSRRSPSFGAIERTAYGFRARL